MTSETMVRWRLLDGYQRDDSAYDEILGADNALRPQYEVFVRSLEAIGRDELASRWEAVRSALRDNGVTYNVYGDPHGTDRPWRMDMMPLVISAAEWAQLEAGLIQRTRLLNLVLADVYGAQSLLRDGLLPPALVLGSPAFLRPCHAVSVPRNVYLHLHAIDLVRTTDGRWSVLADRTQAPSGAGYALENRIVLSRSLPEAFRDCRVQRLASFFRGFRDGLAALAPGGRAQPNIVLLTPGPYNETYFEHAYLARYLGLTLVEGADLTVRGSRVFIKMLAGLEPVDVIFRRLDDSFCDPLELRADSALGVPGLVEAVRTGNVTVANALGSGVVESAAMLPFLPRLCRHLLREELMLPSVATWWCGEPDSRAHVIDHVGGIVAKRVFSTVSQEPSFGRKLGLAERADLLEEINARPESFVGQEQVALSMAPVWLGQKLEPRPLVLRAYVASAGDTFAVMPGGLTRVASARDLPVVSMQSGGGSKDTWVLSDGPVSHVTLLPPDIGTLRHARRASDVPSRVADNLFWLGRQAERAEHMLRLQRSTVVRLTQEDAGEDSSEFAALLGVLVGLDLLPARVDARMPLSELEQEMFTFLFDPAAPTGLRKALNELRRLASIVRDRLSVDTYRILNQLHQDFRLQRGGLQFDDVLTHLDRMITDLAAFSGMEMENMTRGHGWRFLDVGRRLERAINMTTLLRHTLARRFDVALLEPLLEIADSSMTYRRRYFARPQPLFVLDLLVADHTNARALAFQIDALSAHVQHLPRDPRAPSPTREEQLIARSASLLRDTNLEALGEGASGLERQAIAELLDEIEEQLIALSNTITFFYFTHGEQRVS